MRIAIVGSRDWPYPEMVKGFVYELRAGTVVVSGGAKGVDSMAEQFAKELNLQVVVHRPKWEEHGKRAGFMRNKDIVDDADEVIAFWCNKSKGTKHTIDLAHKQAKPVTVIECHDGLD